MSITEIRLTRWRLASAVLRKSQHHWGQYAIPYKRFPEVEAGCPVHEFPAKNPKANFVAPQDSNWPGDNHLGREDKVLRSCLLSFATAAYGGIHALAWNEYFATASERHWWRFSSVFVAASGVALSLRPVTTLTLDCFDKEFKNIWLPVVRVILALLFTNFLFLAGSTYVIVRPYLVVEALISLRRLPINGYQTPRFIQLIPHLSTIVGETTITRRLLFNTVISVDLLTSISDYAQGAIYTIRTECCHPGYLVFIPGIASSVKGSAVVTFVLWTGRRIGGGARVIIYSTSVEKALQ